MPSSPRSMASRPGVRARERAAVEALDTALEVASRTGLQMRAFRRQTSTVLGRLRWLLTGRITPGSPFEAEALGDTNVLADDDEASSELSG